ncbi:MAG: Trm112 family protein [Gemmatimonadetes bacterium]|nr:Trm112 family protein [Gemmatimonadota bacterium]
MSLPAELLQILVCPACKGVLEHHLTPEEALVCRACAVVYRVDDGIPVMLRDEAMPLDAAVYPLRAEG